MANGKVVWFGWITFAAVMLTMLGLFNVFEGLVALLENNVTYVNGDNLVVVNLTGWGILLLVFGALLIAVGIGLLARNKVARIAAIVVVGLHALAQIAALSAYPIWSLLMIALDVVILFALTAHWADATLDDDDTVPATVGAHAHRPEPRTGSDAHPAPTT
jgi:hypothetical protein